jgi:hypothetical protein
MTLRIPTGWYFGSQIPQGMPLLPELKYDGGRCCLRNIDSLSLENIVKYSEKLEAGDSRSKKVLSEFSV